MVTMTIDNDHRPTSHGESNFSGSCWIFRVAASSQKRKYKYFLAFVKWKNGIISILWDGVDEFLFILIVGFQFVDSALFGQIRWAVLGALSKYFWGKDGSPLREIDPYVYDDFDDDDDDDDNDNDAGGAESR